MIARFRPIPEQRFTHPFFFGVCRSVSKALWNLECARVYRRIELKDIPRYVVKSGDVGIQSKLNGLVRRDDVLNVSRRLRSTFVRFRDELLELFFRRTSSVVVGLNPL